MSDFFQNVYCKSITIGAYFVMMAVVYILTFGQVNMSCVVKEDVEKDTSRI